MRTTKETLQQIQSITFDAYKSSGQAAALLGEPASSPEAITRTLEQTAASLEQGTVELRGLCESCLPELLTIGRKPVLPPLEVAGTISVNEFGWLMLELNTLLPHCIQAVLANQVAHGTSDSGSSISQKLGVSGKVIAVDCPPQPDGTGLHKIIKAHAAGG